MKSKLYLSVIVVVRFVQCDMFSQKFNLHEYIFEIQRKQLFDVCILTKTNICLRIDQFYYNDKMGDKDKK